MKHFNSHGSIISVAETPEEVKTLASIVLHDDREQGAAISANMQAFMQHVRQARQVIQDAARLGKPLAETDYQALAAIAGDGTALAYEERGY